MLTMEAQELREFWPPRLCGTKARGNKGLSKLDLLMVWFHTGFYSSPLDTELIRNDTLWWSPHFLMKTFSLIKPARWSPRCHAIQRERCTQKVRLGDTAVHASFVLCLQFMERIHCSIESGGGEQHVLLEEHRQDCVCTWTCTGQAALSFLAFLCHPQWEMPKQRKEILGAYLVMACENTHRTRQEGGRAPRDPRVNTRVSGEPEPVSYCPQLLHSSGECLPVKISVALNSATVHGFSLLQTSSQDDITECSFFRF